jgi:hypothetical protein
MRARQGKDRGGSPRALADLLRTVYPSREPEDAAAIRVFTWWRRAVPARVFARARPVRLSHGVLYVHTASPAWALELDYLKQQLLASVQKHAPEARIRELRFKTGPLPEAPKGSRPDRKRPEPVAVAVLPESLARALASIDDDALREAISSAAAVGLGRETKR